MHHKRNSAWLMLGLALATVFLVAGLLVNSNAAAHPPIDTQNTATSYGIDAIPNAQDEDPNEPIDHSQFDILAQEFANPQQLTKACLNCHVDAADQVMHTTHWTWEFVNETTGQTLGKKNLVNNFCVAVASNEPRCTSCHVGYGWADNTFDFTAQENVDCVVCHDTTGTYKKTPTGAGAPAEDVDLTVVAQNVGKSSRQTCGACHFYGGGGDEVKHGDLDSSLNNPDRSLDVHMDAEGLNFACTSCHVTEDHFIPGSRYSMDPTEWQGCESCHTTEPHVLNVLNTHAEKVACQTCHIPEFARGDIATKMTWDWSVAGNQNDDGTDLITKDDDGNITYHTKKGAFTWQENVTPKYVWFNGTVEYTLIDTPIDPSQTVPINQFIGDKDDQNAKIWPTKHFTAIQPYDSGNNTLAIPHLFGSDDTAYWKNFDWNKALAAGMEYIGAPYSGQYDFVETEMYWPITHMVSPATDAVRCQECHTKEEGRLDFAALGYDNLDVIRLTNFPPTMTKAVQEAEILTPQNCVNCHEDQYTLWLTSKHGKGGTGCAACHLLEGEGEHPASAAYSIDKTGELCGTCHLGQYDDWKESVHEDKLIACSSCHEPHTQQMKLAPEKTNVCENCHLLEAEEVVHSTHTLAGVTCVNCHVNSVEGTGHTYEVGTGSCLSCHGESMHTASLVAELTDGNVPTYDPEASESKEGEGEEVAEMPEEETMMEEEHETETAETPAGAGVNFPIWMLVAVGIFIGVGGYWLLAGQEPGSQHPENAPEETEE